VSATEASRLLALAFDPAVEPADDEVSRRILDAALAVAAASGMKNLTMDEVARRAGVGRMTVYRRFRSKSELIDELAVRECRRCLAQIMSAIEPDAPAADRLAALATATLKVIHEHPLLERLGRVEPEALLGELSRDGSTVFALVRDFLIGQIERGQADGELIDADPALLAEVGVRLGASFVLMPDSVLELDDEVATRTAFRTLIAPLVR